MEEKDLMDSVGRIVELKGRYKPAVLVVDGDGIGAGVVDRLNQIGQNVVEFRGGKSLLKKKIILIHVLRHIVS